MRIRTIRLLLEEQGWQVVATNGGGKRFYHAEHLGRSESFSGNLEAFRAKAEARLR